MTTEEILGFENNDGTEVHLVRDRLFWQAWEHSAFLFLKNFRKYQVHHKFVQKVSKDLVWLGFPKNVLQDIHKTSQQRGFSYEAVSDSHIVIKGIPAIEGFDKWKSNVIAAPKEPPPQKEPKPASNTLKIEAKTSEYLLYRLVFDFTIYCTKLIPKVNRVYRHPIGDRISDSRSKLLDSIEKIRDFLKNELKLTLHPKKINLQPAAYGFDFLGVHILPYRVYPGTRLRKNCKLAVKVPLHNNKTQQARLISYEGLFKHLNGTAKLNALIEHSKSI